MMVAQLGLSDPEGCFDLAVVDLNLPTVEVGLQQNGSGAVQVRGEQEGGFAVILAFAAVVRHGRDQQQTQGSPAGAAAPEHRGDLFISDIAPLSAVKDSNLLP